MDSNVTFTECTDVALGRGGKRQIEFTCYVVPTWCSATENAIGAYQAITRHPLAVPRQPQTASADLSTRG